MADILFFDSSRDETIRLADQFCAIFSTFGWHCISAYSREEALWGVPNCDLVVASDPQLDYAGPAIRFASQVRRISPVPVIIISCEPINSSRLIWLEKPVLPEVIGDTIAHLL